MGNIECIECKRCFIKENERRTEIVMEGDQENITTGNNQTVKKIPEIEPKEQITTGRENYKENNTYRSKPQEYQYINDNNNENQDYMNQGYYEEDSSFINEDNSKQNSKDLNNDNNYDNNEINNNVDENEEQFEEGNDEENEQNYEEREGTEYMEELEGNENEEEGEGEEGENQIQDGDNLYDEEKKSIHMKLLMSKI